MRSAEPIFIPEIRPGGHPLGVHRVLEPPGVLPQAALRLDNSLPIYQNELLLQVEKINLDSASFRQLAEECGQDPQRLGDRVLQITQKRGKMENPVTGSGGMLVGRVQQIGGEFGQVLKLGERVASLVSLTLTPLILKEVNFVDFARGQLRVQGQAVLFASAGLAPMPEDLKEELALAALDVCGAPAWVRKKIRSSDRVLIIGLGKAGVLSAAAAREVLPRDSLWVADLQTSRLEGMTPFGLFGHAVKVDAGDPLGFEERLVQHGAPSFDLVVDTCNVPGTETAALLAVKPGGCILFFNMATNFQRAVLTAEGLGKEVEMIMGEGFVEGHWKYALDLVRKHREMMNFEG